ncbi:MAG: type II toxin-antitoxin system VapC family toxin [Firmicutes bacterium]|nr:type II toxin-antitoxin system VapC family toxin [Bacillota bacterium]
MKVVVDTNIIIDHLRGVPQAAKVLKEAEDGSLEGLISTITIMETMAAPKMSEERLAAVKELLAVFEHCPVDSHTATVAGSLLAKYRRSHGLEPMDALIAATAKVNEAVLFTLNTKHFRYIEGLIAVNPCDAEE